MPVKRTIPYSSGIFSITFTCYNWLNLIEKVEGYDLIYNWFNYLTTQGHYVIGYVIMPNHVHVMIGFVETAQSINSIVGNGKRFIAYEIIKRLEKLNEKELLQILEAEIETKRKENNKKHNVWQLSFDWKHCESERFIIQKLEYYHNNPIKGSWNLCPNPIDYLHSSARFYMNGECGVFSVKNYAELNDVNLSDATSKLSTRH